jgi:hypothetical protein
MNIPCYSANPNEALGVSLVMHAATSCRPAKTMNLAADRAPLEQPQHVVELHAVIPEW